MITTVSLINFALALALFIFHLLFSSLFRWKPLLAGMDPVNRGILLVLNVSIATIALLIALFALAIATGWLPIDRGARFTLVGIGLFLMVRAVFQPIYFDMTNRASLILMGLLMIAMAQHFGLAYWG
jgi:hypothetical protein